MRDNVPEKCRLLCSLFEGELLLELLLRHWEHPFADDAYFRNGVIEAASEVLTAAAMESCTDVFLEDVPPHEMNFVAAVWYVEFCSALDDAQFRVERQRWLDAIRRALPSCFVSTDYLEP